MIPLCLALRLLAAEEAVGDLVSVRIAADSSGPTTRLVLTLSRPVRFAVEAVPGGLRLSSEASLRVEPPEARWEDALLVGWKATDREILLSLGPGYRSFTSYELKNPPRLVVDLSGEKKGQPRAARTGAARPPARVVVLDPGHGGVETGAVGPGGLAEKDLALDLARRIRALLEKNGGLTVVLTREDDRLVSLEERTAIANHNRAELFVSIHLNSSPATAAYGAETYFLSADATDDEARTLAALENRVFDPTGEPAPPARSAEGAAPNELDLILWDLAQNEYLAESARLAESVQRELNLLAGTRDRGVRQAPFAVLMGATMPAILVEVGFLSNPAEEARFRDEAYRQKVADAIGRAVLDYLERVRSAEKERATRAPSGRLE